MSVLWKCVWAHVPASSTPCYGEQHPHSSGSSLWQRSCPRASGLAFPTGRCRCVWCLVLGSCLDSQAGGLPSPPTPGRRLGRGSLGGSRLSEGNQPGGVQRRADRTLGCKAFRTGPPRGPLSGWVPGCCGGSIPRPPLASLGELTGGGGRQRACGTNWHSPAAPAKPAGRGRSAPERPGYPVLRRVPASPRLPGAGGDSRVAAPLACAPSAQGSRASAPRGGGTPRTSLSSRTRVGALRGPLGASEGRVRREPPLLWSGAGTPPVEGLEGRRKDALSGIGPPGWRRVPKSGGLASATAPLRATPGGVPERLLGSKLHFQAQSLDVALDPGALHRWEAWIGSGGAAADQCCRCCCHCSVGV